jgi:hypothetical protein
VFLFFFIHPLNKFHHCVDLLSDRSSSITTTTRQSKTKFSQFFGRSSSNNKSNQIEHSLLPSNTTNHSLKRTKSVTKLERQKRQPQSLITGSHL